MFSGLRVVVSRILVFFEAPCIHKISHCRGCRVQCRVTKIVPLVHKPTLVSYKNVPSIIVRSKQSLKAPKSQISLSGIFFEAPCTTYNNINVIL